MLEENKHGILLESGTNEIEVMEFTINGNLYGINVAKVKEILMSSPVKPMPHAHPAVEGIFKPRDWCSRLWTCRAICSRSPA